MTRRRAHIWLAIAILAGGLVRVYLAWTASVISRDGVAYLTVARDMADDWREGIRADHQAGLPLLICWVEPLIRPWAPADQVLRWQRAGQVVSLISGLACIPLIYWLGRRLCGLRTGLLAAWIWALLPDACRFSADVLTDMPALALMLAGLALAMVGLHGRSLANMLAAGLVIGAAYVIRAESAAVVVAAAILAPFQRPASLRWRLAAPVVVVLGFIVLAGTYVWLEGGELFSEKPGLLRIEWLAPSPAAPPPPATAARDLAPTFSAGKANAPPLAQIEFVPCAACLGRSLLNLLGKLSDSLNGVWLVLGAAYLFLPDRRRLRSGWLAAPLLFWTMHTVACIWLDMKYGYLSRRHVMPLNVGIVLMAAGTLVYTARKLRHRLKNAKSRWFALARRSDAIALVVIVAGLLPWLIRDINDSRHYIRQAARWIRSHYDAPPGMYAQYGWVPFYAGARNWVEDRDPRRFGLDPNFANADLAIVALHGADPQRILSGAPETVQLTEVARFTSPDKRRGVVIYRVQSNDRPVASNSATPP